MIIYTSGDLLKSNSEALVNTVNCEGYMGKGIAYQFKLQYPENNKEYVEACKTGKLKVGKLHHTSEQGKIIINFPTKDKWRAKSKMEYIDKGLDALIILIKQLDIKSISLPPLGSGNGGLVWGDVKNLIERKLNQIASETNIYIYESSKSHGIRNTTEPLLNVSALILMEIKSNLHKFNTTLLQSAAVLTDLLSVNKFFQSDESDIPISKVITDLSEKIKDFQAYHNVETTEEAKSILYNKIISEGVKVRINEALPNIKKACAIINSVETDSELFGFLTLVKVINQNEMLSADEIVERVLSKAQYSGHTLTQEEIINGLERLIQGGIVEMALLGYSINRN